MPTLTRNIHVDVIDDVTIRLHFAKSNLIALGIALSDGDNTPSGDVMNGALSAIACLIESVSHRLEEGCQS